MRRRWLRLALWVTTAGALAAGLPLWFYASRDGALLDRPALLHNGWLGLGALCVAMWALLASTPPGALTLSPRVGKRLILLVSVAPIAAALLWLAPVLSAEVLRYRFDGRAWLLGISPYAISPADASAMAEDAGDPELQPDALDAAAPHPHRTSLNLPVSQAAFVAARTLEYLASQSGVVAAPADGAATRASDPQVEQARQDDSALEAGGTPGWRATMLDLPWWRQLFFWRCLLAAALLLTTAELIAWLRERGRSPWWAALFAWQPLVLIETVGMGHQDAVGVLFLVAALRRADVGRYRRAALCLAASAAVKPLALLALPFLIRLAWRGPAPAETAALESSRGRTPPGPASARRALVWFAAAFAMFLLPMWVHGGWPDLTLTPELLVAGGADEAANPIYRALELQLAAAYSPSDPAAAADRTHQLRAAAWALCGLIVVAVGAISWIRRARPAAALYSMLMTGLLLGPVTPPWLLIWPLGLVPALVGRGGLTALVWGATAGLSYSAGGIATEAAAWQFAPVYVIALIELAASFRRGGERAEALTAVPERPSHSRAAA